MSKSQNNAIDDAEWWGDRYSKVQPIGYELRNAFPQRWFRIHSLPEAKRNPDNQSEWNELIARHRVVANEILGAGSPCYVLTPCSCAQDKCYLDLSLRPMNSLPEYRPDPEDPPTGPYYGARISWDFASFEPILRAAATWKTLVTIVSEEEMVVYAPYEGGADILLPDSSRRDALRTKFSDFLSSRSDGM